VAVAVAVAVETLDAITLIEKMSFFAEALI
jgi:hypothetical protein